MLNSSATPSPARLDGFGLDRNLFSIKSGAVLVRNRPHGQQDRPQSEFERVVAGIAVRTKR
jgi:hypothetical protein